MKTDIFHLRIVPIADILVHEEFDEKRSYPLVDNLKKVQNLANPILVAPLDSKRYLQLDGMNRLTAFKLLGFQTIMVQIIDYNDQETVELSSWSHLFSYPEKKFLVALKKISGITVKDGSIDNVGHRYIRESDYGIVHNC